MIIDLEMFNSWVIKPYIIMILLSISIGTAYICYKTHKICNINNRYLFYIGFLNIITIIACGLTIDKVLYNRVSFNSTGGACGVVISGVVSSLIFNSNKILKIEVSSLPLMYSISKIGCTLAGCCGGRETHKAFGVKYINGNYDTNYYTVPIQLIEVITFAIIFIIFLKMYDKLSVYSMVAICCISKTLLDYFRYTHNNGNILSRNQIMCIIILLVMCIIQYIIRKRTTK